MTAIASAFDEAAPHYAQSAIIQQQVATEFSQWLRTIYTTQSLPLPQRIGEIGCGTGFLSRCLLDDFSPEYLICSDIAPQMVAECQDHLTKYPTQRPFKTHIQYLVGDGQTLTFEPAVTAVVSSLCFQWFDDLQRTITHHLQHSSCVAFSMLLAGSFEAWHQAHQACGYTAGLRQLPSESALNRIIDKAIDTVRVNVPDLTIQRHQHLQTFSQSFDVAIDFARSLRAIGAHTPRSTHQPISLHRVLQQLPHGIIANYEVGFVCLYQI
jgi:malonyl-CoA O-methyltransferase